LIRGRSLSDARRRRELANRLIEEGRLGQDGEEKLVTGSAAAALFCMEPIRLSPFDMGEQLTRGQLNVAVAHGVRVVDAVFGEMQADGCCDIRRKEQPVPRKARACSMKPAAKAYERFVRVV
jgi:hypothetical protein